MPKLSKTAARWLYLFHQGTCYNAQDFLGVHRARRGRGYGAVFRLWAPHAREISVVGDFNGWNPQANPMTRLEEGGVWECFVSGVKRFDLYKYAVTGRDGRQVLKTDPYGVHMETRPRTASRFYELDGFLWKDQPWMERRVQEDFYALPMNIYEMHLGTWRTYPDGTPFSYEKVADELIPYLKEMGYTHVEFLPLSEYPLDDSWGYQVTGYFAPTSRYGTPHQLMSLVDRLHRAGIGVLLDWVPSHFPKNQEGLSLFDGEPCYEYRDPDKGEHKQWGTKVFDYGRCEVQSFLISNALYWLNTYHFDGLRVDAVASMLYLDYMREPGQWTPNSQGGREHLEAVAFLQKLNAAVRAHCPGAITIAEESSSWEGVTRTENGGLGFTFKWNMGWMNDICTYIQADPIYRAPLHDKLTFPLVYAFSEHYVLPISHDEVVHGKRSLLDKMPGEYEMKFAGLRTFLAYMMSHPGKKLLFMGQEFGQFIEWDCHKGLDWLLLDYDRHRQMQRFSQELNHFYLRHPAFWQQDDGWEGFQWIDCKDVMQNIIVYRRIDRQGKEIVVLVNFAPVEHLDYRIGVPEKGMYRELLNTDRKEFGGHGRENGRLRAEQTPCHGMSFSLCLRVPPMSALYLERVSRQSSRRTAPAARALGLRPASAQNE